MSGNLSAPSKQQHTTTGHTNTTTTLTNDEISAHSSFSTTRHPNRTYQNQRGVDLRRAITKSAFIFWGVGLGLAKQQSIVTSRVSSGLQVLLHYARQCFSLYRFLYDTTLCVWRDTTVVGHKQTNKHSLVVE